MSAKLSGFRGHGFTTWAVTGVAIALLAVLAAVGGGGWIGRSADAQNNPATQTQPASPNEALNARFAALSPDGTKIAFSWQGDIWVVGAGGGRATRLTRHEAHDSLPVWSPDSQSIAFTSNRGFGYDVYLIPATGGTARKLTHDAAADFSAAFTPDGRNLIVLSTRSLQFETWRVPLDGSTPVRLTRFGATNVAISADGERLVYVRGTNDPFQMRYTGSANYDVYVQSASGDLSEIPQKITDTPFNEFHPFFTADGTAVIYRAEEGGTFNIFRKPLDGTGAAEKLTNFTTGPGVEQLHYNPHQNTIVFSKNFRVFVMKLGETAPASEPQILSIVVVEDAAQDPIVDRLVGKGVGSADAAQGQFVFELEGDIWTMPETGGIARKLVGTPFIEQWPRLSRDGTMIAFQLERDGNTDIYVADLRTRQTRRITDHPAGDFYHGWSPDGKYLVFASERTGDREIWIVNVNDPQDLRRLTNSPGSDDDPVFTPDGEKIVFDSARGGTQSIWIMERNGDNPRRLFDTGRFDQVARVSPDGKWVVFESIDMQSRSEPNIQFGSIEGGYSMTVAQGRAPFFSTDGQFIVFIQGSGGETSLKRIPTPREVAIPQEIPMIARVTETQSQVFTRLFNETWQQLRDGFYDPDHHGQNWDAVRARYAPLVPLCQTREELSNLVNRALGELGASHMGFYSGSEYARPRAQTGYLGAELQLVPLDGDRHALRVVDVLRNSPADGVWIRHGDHILAVNGTPIGATTNFYRLMTNQQKVKLQISIGDDFSNTREVEVQPIGPNDLAQLRYRNWESSCQTRVETGSNGEIGYVHLTGMNPANHRKIVEYLQGPGKDKKALILDVRNNGGGYLHNELMDIFARRPFGVFQHRGRERVYQPELTWTRPVVLLINERSFSDAEVFPAGFKSLGVGPVIGVRTPGGVIGTNDITLFDGSRLRVPRVGWYTIEGRNMEGNGVDPDIHVPLTLEDELAGRDPQLQKALDVAKELLARRAAAAAANSTPSSPATNGSPSNDR